MRQSQAIRFLVNFSYLVKPLHSPFLFLFFAVSTASYFAGLTQDFGPVQSLYATVSGLYRK
jgi:hypothetical protein